MGYVGSIKIDDKDKAGVINLKSVSSKESGGIVTTVVKADINRLKHQCDFRSVPKAVVYSPLLLKSSRLAVSGAFKNEASLIDRAFLDLLNERGVDFYVKGSLNTPVSEVSASAYEGFSSYIREIADKYDAQYVIAGVLNDVSLSRVVGGSGDGRVVRNFDVVFSLYDGITGNKVNSYNYERSFFWPFGYSMGVGRSDAVFWSSHFGRGVYQTLMEVQEDISSDIKCARLRARIIENHDGDLLVSAGSIQGIDAGDFFVLQKKIQSGFSSKAQFYQRSRMSPYVVDEAYPTNSLITPVDDGNVDYTANSGDIVVLETPE